MSSPNLNNFFYNSNELLCVANTDGYFVEINPLWEVTTGYTAEELKSRPFIEFVHPEDVERTIKEAADLGQGKQSVQFMNRYLTKTGNVIHLKWNASIKDGFIYAVATNITDLKEQTYFFNEMQDAASIGYWKLDLETMTPHWSDKTYDIHGVPRGEDVDLENAINYYAPEARETVGKMVQDCIDTGAQWDEELPFINAHGHNMWVRTIGRAKRVNGKTVELHGVFQDITERKMMDLMLEQSLKESEKYKKALDSHAIVAITDTKGVITYVNEKFSEISGYSQYELIGKTHALINSGYHPKEFFATMWGTILSGEQWRGLVKNKAKQGHDYWVDTTITPIKNREGQVTEFIAIRMDVTKQMELEERLKEQQANLVKSSRLASLGEMAGGVAHEINNPLAIITTATTIMKGMLSAGKDVSPALLQPNVDTIEKTVKRISEIVDGLRSFSRDRGDDIEYDKEVLQTSTVIDDTLKFCREKFKSRGVVLDVDVDKSLQFEVNPTQISQILLNLLNNAFYAVKDSEEKVITVTSQLIDDKIRISVADTGVGIPKENQDKVFQPFFTTKPVGAGTGLGLGISYGIASRHGGQLYLEPQEKGTKFVLELDPAGITLFEAG